MDSWEAAGSLRDTDCRMAGLPSAGCEGFMSCFIPDSIAVFLRTNVSMDSYNPQDASSVLKVAVP